MSESSKKWILVIIGIPLCVVLYLSVKLPTEEKNRILNNYISVVGKVYHVGHNLIKISYEVEGKRYFATKSRVYKGLVIGEQFVTLVDKDDRDRILVLFDKPVVQNIQKDYISVDFKSAKRLRLNRIYVIFRYVYAEKIYERCQKVDESVNIDDYVVFFKKNNPQIGYLLPPVFYD